MKQLTAFLPLLLAFAFGSFAVADDTIVPGKRIGEVALGMEHAEVLRLLGAPHRQEDLERTGEAASTNPTFLRGKSEVQTDLRGIIRDDWITPLPVPKSDGSVTYMADFMAVYFRSRKVVQIEIRTQRFKTSGGLSLMSDGPAFRKTFPHITEIACKLSHPSSGGWPGAKHILFYQDAREEGIAWRFGAMGSLFPDPDPDGEPEVIVVHEANAPLLIDPDGDSRFIWKDAPVRHSEP